jgi:hypothetical protein
MSTFLVTWNPDKYPWDSQGRPPAAIKQTAAGRRYKGGWSTGGRKSGIAPGQDRVFMLRQGSEPRGIVASGWFTSPVCQGPHWDRTPGKVANYADVSWDVVLGDHDVMPLALLKSTIAGVHWEPKSGGALLASPADTDLERLWTSHMGRVHPGPKNDPKPVEAP